MGSGYWVACADTETRRDDSQTAAAETLVLDRMLECGTLSEGWFG